MNLYESIGKRLFDVVFSSLALLLCLPVFILLFIIIKFNSSGPAFFLQKRMGLKGKEFSLIKFRTMYNDARKQNLQFEPGVLSRVTVIGRILRLTKIDELPQLVNVLKGDMSLVGPRPEVPKYRSMYKGRYEKILDVKPGITDEASIKYRNEEDLLSGNDNPDQMYETEILPDKLNLGLDYIDRGISFKNDLRIIFNTVRLIGKGSLFI